MEGETSSATKATKGKTRSSAAKTSNNVGCEIPDLTVGLCTYSLQNKPWSARVQLSKLDQIRLFDRCFLSGLREKFGLPIPNRLADKSIQDSTPQFAFGLWEAKSAVTKNNPLTTLMQSAKKVKAMLRCQHVVYEKSSVSGVPLAWYFNNIGSHWTVYGCHIEKNPRMPQSPRYVSCCIYVKLPN
jgi:hypothetical protein